MPGSELISFLRSKPREQVEELYNLILSYQALESECLRLFKELEVPADLVQELTNEQDIASTDDEHCGECGEDQANKYGVYASAERQRIGDGMLRRAGQNGYVEHATRTSHSGGRPDRYIRHSDISGYVSNSERGYHVFSDVGTKLEFVGFNEAVHPTFRTSTGSS